MRTRDIYGAAVKKYGRESQIIICMEEMAELTKELSKNIRGSKNVTNISEEMADVEIMLEQLRVIFGNCSEVDTIKEEKLIRLAGDANKGRKDKLRVRVYKNAQDADAWNAGEVDVLLVHPASCAYGLNLQAGGHHVVWYGLNWSFELNDQGNCRLWRQGSPYDKVFIHYLIVQGCQDEDVMATIRDRADTHEAVMRALKARIKKIKEDVQ